MDIGRIRALKDQLSVDLAGADGETQRPSRTSLDDPIYISSPLPAAASAGKNLPGGSGPGEKKKRWAAVRGVFGSLGKFKKAGRRSEAADATIEAPSAGEEAGAFDQAAVPKFSGEAAARDYDAAETGSTGDRKTSVQSEATPKPNFNQGALEESPIRTVAVEPTPRNAALSPQEPTLEEATPRGRVTAEGENGHPFQTEDKVFDGLAAPCESTLFASDRNARPSVEAEHEGSVTSVQKACHAPIAESDGTLEPESAKLCSTAAASGLRAGGGAIVPKSVQLQKLPAGAGKLPTPEAAWISSKLWPLTAVSGQETRSCGRFSAARYAALGEDAATWKESLAVRLATEAEKREVARRRRLAAGLIIAECLRLEMEETVYLELDHLERQRGRIQAHEEEEEERWRRIEECHLHASTPLHLRSQRDESLGDAIKAEEKERAWRLSQDSIMGMSNRSRSTSDDARRTINAELSKVVWPAVESQAPAGEEEAHIPPSRSRHDPTAVLFFCLAQRDMLHSPKRRLVRLETAPPAQRPRPGRAVDDSVVTERDVTSVIVPKLISSILPSRRLSTPPPVQDELEETSENAHIGWLASLKAAVAHIAEDTVEGAAHLAQQASDAATKSASSLPGTSVPLWRVFVLNDDAWVARTRRICPKIMLTCGASAMPLLNLGDIKSPREWSTQLPSIESIPGMGLLSLPPEHGAEKAVTKA